MDYGNEKDNCEDVMKKLIWLVVLGMLLVSGVASAGPGVEKEACGIKLTPEINYDEGVERVYYTNGQVYKERHFNKENKWHGSYKTYYPNGQLAREENYKNGKEEGVGRIYYTNGQLEREFTYKDGKKEGIYKVYYKNGNLKHKIDFKDGIAMSSEWYLVTKTPEEIVAKTIKTPNMQTKGIEKTVMTFYKAGKKVYEGVMDKDGLKATGKIPEEIKYQSISDWKLEEEELGNIFKDSEEEGLALVPPEK